MAVATHPVLIGGARFEPAEQATTNPAWLAALQEQHRKNNSACLCAAGVDLPLVIRLYGRNAETRHYGLAKAQDTGLNHDPACRFFGEGSDDDEPDKDTLPAFDVADDGQLRAHLSFSLQLAEPIDGPAPAPRPGKAPGPSRARASEAAMLFRLWREAGLNVYNGKNRSWFMVAFKMLKTAEKIVINAKGETLADYLLVAAGGNDPLVSSHNQKVLDRAEHTPSRLIVIGRMRTIDTSAGGKKLLPVHDFVGLPKALIPAISIDNLLARRALVRNLLQKTVPGHVVMMACIEPEKAPWWKVHSTAVMPTSPQFLPTESSYVVDFEGYLVEQGRHFIKPIAINELGENDQRPDYILLDTTPRVRCEVWGMQTPEYLSGKAKRLAEYAQKGQDLVSWSAEPREPFPELPPAAAYKEKT